MIKHALVALGANLNYDQEPAASTILSAIQRLAGEYDLHIRLSKLYRTPCFPIGAGPDYINAAGVFTLGKDMTPESVLSVFHQVEADFGRKRAQRWAGRTLDIDLLAVGDSVLPNLAEYRHWQGLAPEQQAIRAPDQLILPHPRLQDRAFVLVPLADVAPDWRHPVLGKTVLQMRDALPKADLDTVVLA